MGSDGRKTASSGESGKAGTNAGQLKAMGMGVAGKSINGGPRVMSATGGRQGTLVTSGGRGGQRAAKVAKFRPRGAFKNR